MGRKFWFTVITHTITTNLLFFKMITADNWVTVTLALATGYLGANVAQKIFHDKKVKIDDKED